MVTSFRALLLAGVLSLAVCDWCDEHAALQIWDQDSNPGMIPHTWWEPGGRISAFTQVPQGRRYFLGQPSGGSPASVVMSSPDDEYESHSLVVALGEAIRSSTGLAISSDGLRLFIAYGLRSDKLQECPTTPESQLGKCTTICDGSEYAFDGLVYDDATHVLYAACSYKSVIVAFTQDPNGNWEKNERIVAGNADKKEHADLTGLNSPSTLSLYEGDLLILDGGNDRIVRWAPGDLAAETEYKADGVLGWFALSVGEGKIYFANILQYAVYTLDIDNPNAPKQRVVGDCGRGTDANQLSGSSFTRIYVNAPAYTIIILDGKRLVEWRDGG